MTSRNRKGEMVGRGNNKWQVGRICSTRSRRRSVSHLLAEGIEGDDPVTGGIVPIPPHGGISAVVCEVVVVVVLT